MLILSPVKDSFLSQDFGENKAYVKVDPNGTPYRPFRVTSSAIGTIPFYKALGMNGHNGRDEACYYKAPIYFPVIAETKWWANPEMDADGGVGVDVFSADRVFLKELPPEAGDLAKNEWEQNDKKVYIKIRFWHLYDVKLGDKPLTIQTGVYADGSPQMKPEIKLGDCIGWANSTGASSGHHLHWSMKIVYKNSTTLDNDNGYFGAVNFGNRYQDDFILDLLNRKQKLTAEQTLRKMAWHLRHIDRKGAEILRRVADIISAFSVKVGTVLKDVKKD